METKQSNNSVATTDAVKIANQRALFNLEWENDTVFKKRELNYKTKAAFQKDLEAGKISKYTTVFIKDSKEIYKNGQYYGNSEGGGVSGLDEISLSQDIINGSTSSGNFTETEYNKILAASEKGFIIVVGPGGTKFISKVSKSTLSEGKIQLNLFIGEVLQYAANILLTNYITIKDKSENYAFTSNKLITNIYNGTDGHIAINTSNGIDGSTEIDLIVNGAGTKFLSDDGQYKTIETISSAVGKIDSNSDGTGEIFNNYEGEDLNISKGNSSHAEGKKTQANSNSSHAEGNDTKASGHHSHAEGNNTVASGENSHAEGYGSISSGVQSHAEGTSTRAKGDYSHSEGWNTIANGDYSHSEGHETTSIGAKSHAEGQLSKSIGDQSHAEGCQTLAIGNYAHAEGGGAVKVDEAFYTKINDEIIAEWERLYETPTVYETGDGFSMAKGKGSHSEGKNTLALGDYSHAGGLATIASGEGAFAHGSSYVGSSTVSISYIKATGRGAIAAGAVDIESYGIEASGEGSVALGYADNLMPLKATGQGSVAIGDSSGATGQGSVAIGSHSNATGDYSVALGSYCTASNTFSIAIGVSSSTSASYAVSLGQYCSATGMHSHATGYSTKAAAYAQTSIGQHNEISGSENGDAYDQTAVAFMIGNGLSSIIKGNAFKVLFNGLTYADGAYSGSGADYAEFFEWQDGNVNNEDRIGLFVSLDGDKIVKANFSSSYILGIVSGNPTIIGDNPMRWKNKYLTDKWGRPIYEDVEVKYTETEIDENGKTSRVEKTRIDHVMKINPEWDSSLEYKSREVRPEWSAIGMMGKLLVKHDGTLKQGGFCYPSENGIATNSETGYYIMKVYEDTALIMFK